MPRGNIHRVGVGTGSLKKIKQKDNLGMIEPGMTGWRGSRVQKVYNILVQEARKNNKPVKKNDFVVKANQIVNDKKYREFIEERETINNELIKKRAKKIIGGSKVKVVLICDVKNWAWWNKSIYIKKYLSDEFDIDIINLLGKGSSRINKTKHDLYITYGYSYVNHLVGVKKFQKASGVTAHRHRNVITREMKKVGTVHANSMLLKKELEEWGIKDVHYVPNGIDLDLFKPTREKDPDSPFLVGHIGKNSNQKGQDQIIKPAIKKAGAESFFHLSDWTEMIPYTEMYKKYQDMSVFIVASKEDGTPNPALEAMACGVPVISNNIGNMPEIIKNGVNGFIVKKDINSYVNKIKWCKNNREQLIQMGKNARQILIEEGWSWENQAENYRKMFRDMIQKYPS